MNCFSLLVDLSMKDAIISFSCKEISSAHLFTGASNLEGSMVVKSLRCEVDSPSAAKQLASTANDPFAPELHSDSSPWVAHKCC